jgi:hypothetical protein
MKRAICKAIDVAILMASTSSLAHAQYQNQQHTRISSRDTVNSPMGNRAMASQPTPHPASPATTDIPLSKDTAPLNRAMVSLSKAMALRPPPATTLPAKG